MVPTPSLAEVGADAVGEVKDGGRGAAEKGPGHQEDVIGDLGDGGQRVAGIGGFALGGVGFVPDDEANLIGVQPGDVVGDGHTDETGPGGSENGEGG